MPRRRQIDSLVPSETFLHPAFFPSSRSPDFFQRLIFYPFFSFLFFSFFRIIVSIYRIYLDNFFLIYRSLRCIIYLGNFFYLSSPSIYYIFGQFSFRFIIPCDISYIWIIFFYLSFPSIYFMFGQFFLFIYYIFGQFSFRFIVPFGILYICFIYRSLYYIFEQSLVAIKPKGLFRIYILFTCWTLLLISLLCVTLHILFPLGTLVVYFRMRWIQGSS